MSKTEIATGKVTEYTWDYRNRLTKVLERASTQGPATKVVDYSYDVFDRRVGKDVDDDGDEDVDRGERYVYDGGFGLPSPVGGRGAGGEGIALQFDGSDNLTHRYLFGPAVDQVLADEDASGDVLWSLADHEGTVRDLAEYDSGQDETTVVNHVKYDAFGNITAQSNSSLTPHFAYTGREWDADAGLYYYRARWYDPKTGRFLSEDPVGFAGGDANLQRYVRNNPLNFTDPSGTSGGGSGGSGSGGGWSGGGWSGGGTGGAPPPMAPAPPTDPGGDAPIDGEPGVVPMPEEPGIGPGGVESLCGILDWGVWPWNWFGGNAPQAAYQAGTYTVPSPIPETASVLQMVPGTFDAWTVAQAQRRLDEAIAKYGLNSPQELKAQADLEAAKRGVDRRRRMSPR